MFRSLLPIRVSRTLRSLGRAMFRISPVQAMQKRVSFLVRGLWRGHGRQFSSEGLEESQQVTLLLGC
jgi:hypothetical protein